MKKIIIVSFIILLTFSINKKINSQAITWQKYYDYNNDDNSGNDVVQTYDGGYLFLGESDASDSSGIVLVKTGSKGELQWKKLIGRDSSNGASIISLSISQAMDSGFILSGYVNPAAYLIKIDKNGNIKWIRRYSKPGFSISFFDHKITFDGGIIAVGYIYPPTNAYAAKIDSSGKIEWDTSYSANDFIKVLQSRDSNYYFARYNYLIKADSRGRVIWSRSFYRGGPYMVEDPKGYLFSAGSASVDTMFLNKFDESGNLIWGKKFYPKAYCYSICMALDGSILLAGYLDSLVMGIIAVAKVDADGNSIFTKQILSAIGNNLSFLPNSVKSTTDSGFIMTGFTNYGGFPTMDNILAVKTDQECNAPLITNINSISLSIPSEFVLYQNFPNPFNPTTTIPYDIQNDGIVTIKIYNILGKEVKILVNEFRHAGNYKIIFDGYNLSSGIYFYKLESGNFVQTKRMVLIK